jgi:hypothetical protein
LKIVIASLLWAEVRGFDDQRLGRVAVCDLHLIRFALLADHFAGVAVEPRVIPALGDARVDSQVDAFASVEFLDGSLWRGRPTVPWFVL